MRWILLILVTAATLVFIWACAPLGLDDRYAIGAWALWNFALAPVSLLYALGRFDGPPPPSCNTCGSETDLTECASCSEMVCATCSVSYYGELCCPGCVEDPKFQPEFEPSQHPDIDLPPLKAPPPTEE